MNTSRASTSNDDNLKLCLNNIDISFLLRLVKKSEKVFPTGQEKLENIYLDIDYACKHKVFEKLTKYRGFLGHIEKFKKILYNFD